MKWVQFTVTTVFIHQQQSSTTEVYLYENVILLNYLSSITLSNYILPIDERGELLSMSDTTFILLTLGITPVLSEDRTNEPVLWQQMCPDRYKQS